MTSHHDVAGVVARLRTVDYFSDNLMASRSEADADLIDRLRAERKEAADLLEAQAKALSEAEALAKQLSDALLTVRPLGGSELFINRGGKYYADPEYLKAAIASDHKECHGAKCDAVRANRRALAAEARLAEAMKVIERDMEALTEADTQIEYLHDKFKPTGSGANAIARIDIALTAARAFINAAKEKT